MIAQVLFQHNSFVVTVEDAVAVGLLVLLEAILSADNAIVLALLAYSLPKNRQKIALKIGIWCAFAFRIVAVLFLLQLLAHPLSKKIALSIGGAYLVWLPIKHWREKRHAEPAENGGLAVAAATSILGLGAFWSTVLRIEFTDVIFSVDSILVAMAASSKAWVIITGGVLGIVAMRFVAGGFLKVIERFPAIVDGAYMIVAVAGAKMLTEFAHTMGWIHVNEKWLKGISFGLIVLIFCGSLLVGRRKEEEKAAGRDEGPPG